MRARWGSRYSPVVTTYDLDPPEDSRYGSDWNRDAWNDFVAAQPMEVWDHVFARQVLLHAQRRRKELKLSAAEISERLGRAGWPLTVNSVNGMFGKKGRVSISMPQIIALADALEVAPVDLMFPLDSAPEVAYRLGQFLSSAAARDALNGRATADEYISLRDDLTQAAARVDELRRRREQERRGTP